MARFTEVKSLRVDRLVVSKQQARTRDVEKDLDELVENIRVHGQLEPIIVAPLDDTGDRYEIIAGQRRWLAMQRLQQHTVIAAILDERADEATARVLSVSENIIRKDLSAKDLIDVCTALYRKYGSTKAVAEELGLPYNLVRNYVKFERLRPELKKLVETGRIDVKTALRIDDYHADRPLDPLELEQTVRDVSGMTNAQQADYFRRDRHEGGTRQGTEAVPEPERRSRPGAVRQIIVTLRHEDHTKLRHWAAEKGLGQDKAAAWIINAFLRSLTAGGNHNGSRSDRKRADGARSGADR